MATPEVPTMPVTHYLSIAEIHDMLDRFEIKRGGMRWGDSCDCAAYLRLERMTTRLYRELVARLYELQQAA
jgi:hypothetical protein